MAKVKTTSKRVPLKRRATIHAKAKAHAVKVKRAAKANPALRKKLKKDLGIPNLNPFKAQILRKMEEQHKLLRMQEQTRTRMQGEAALRKRLGGDAGELGGLAVHATARGAAFSDDAERNAAAADAPGVTRIVSNAAAGEATRRAFYRTLKAVVEKSDIIIEVLDARDPLACRALGVETLALSASPPKRVILLLNKIDLVPPEVVQAWLKYLRREFPCVAFKASTQQQRSNLSAPGGGAVNRATQAGEVCTGAGAAGADTLLQLIKNYARSHDMKRAVTVGVVGYPNSGKSSVINSLKRSKAVGVSSMPGFTRTMQEVALDAKVSLLDCPGIIFDDESHGDAEGSDGGAGLLLRNCISLEQIEDPEAAVAGILSRCAPAKLMALYAIPAFATPTEFLSEVAAVRGKLGRGGVPDRPAAARAVLQDWNSGKIPFFVLPPEDVPEPASVGGAMEEDEGGALRVSSGDVGTARIVSEWSKDFDLEGLMAAADCACAAEASTTGVAAYVGRPGARAVIRGIRSHGAREAAAIAAAGGDDDDCGDGEGEKRGDGNDGFEGGNGVGGIGADEGDSGMEVDGLNGDAPRKRVAFGASVRARKAAIVSSKGGGGAGEPLRKTRGSAPPLFAASSERTGGGRKGSKALVRGAAYDFAEHFAPSEKGAT